MARLTRAQAMEKLEKAGIAYGGLNSLDDLIDHPQRRLATLDTPSGPVELMAPGSRVAEAPPLRPVPGLDQHSDAVRREFSSGCSASS